MNTVVKRLRPKAYYFTRLPQARQDAPLSVALLAGRTAR